MWRVAPSRRARIRYSKRPKILFLTQVIQELGTLFGAVIAS
jgi:hypothetical protein